MNPISDLLTFVKSQHPFNHLVDEELQLIEQSLETMVVPAGTHILTQDGPPSQYLYMIREGAVRFTRDEQIIQILEEGELFGFPSMISHSSPTIDVVAEENVLVY